MRVVIIGAGVAGLVSARHAFTSGYECEVLETKPELGGTWFYTDDVETDQYGYPVYSAMYQGLRTNLPKEVMNIPDFPIPEQVQSFLPQQEIWEFLNHYADHFNLKPLIKLNRHVLEIRSLDNNKWLVNSIDKPTGTTIVAEYDSVMICNGSYNSPYMPKLEGLEQFKGQIIHSHSYRKSDSFSGKRVLCIGGGSSGLDLTLFISNVADYVVLSHHKKEVESTEYPSNVEKKPDVKCIKDEETVEFVDGSCCRFDAIVMCTGYKYSFPFLHKSCGITVEDNYIQPLYKHMINIEKPTMSFIGMPSNISAFPLCDLQARFFVKYLNGKLTLPSKANMEADTEKDLQMRLSKGYPKRQAHNMGPFQYDYFKDLAATGELTPIPPVIVKLRNECVRRRYEDLQNFREERYKVVDEENFVKVH